MTKEKEITCVICDSSDWQNVDEHRYKESGMCMCKKCGFITYPKIVRDTSKLKDFYKEEYRRPPTVINIYSGQKKLHYHESFLGKHLAALNKRKPKAKVCEIGAAMGMFLHWIKTKIPKADVYGTELTRSFVRNAWPYQYPYGLIGFLILELRALE